MPDDTKNLILDLQKSRKERAETQLILALYGHGIIQSLRNRSIDLEEARKELFNLDTYHTARRRRLHKKFIEFLEWGMELGNVTRIAPDGSEESYRKMEALLKAVVKASRSRRTRA